MTITALLWAILPSLIVGLVLALWNRREKKRDQDRQKIEANRIKSERLRISLLLAAAKLSYATAMAMKRGYANGEVEAGVEQYQKAMRDFKEFERELVAEYSYDK